MNYYLKIVCGINTRNINLPFNFEVNSEFIDDNCSLETDINIIKDNFMINNGNIDSNIELEFKTEVGKNEELNIIDEITLNEDKDNNIYSMVIYFVKTGDTLWKIAKKFKSTVEDIVRVNNIEDENKIYPGQQLYIPKFINRRVAV